MVVNLQKIFDRTENLNFFKEVNYTRQQGIIGKASLSAGAENLKVYPLSIKLHHSFCNPQKVIDEIEEKISKNEIIDYFQGSVYIGKYVLQNLNVEVLEQIDGYTTACIISLELLEAGEKEENFVQQVVDTTAEGLAGSNNTITARTKNFSASSNTVVNFVKKQAENIKNNMFSSAMEVLKNNEIEAIPEIGRIVAENVASQIVSDIKSAGITQAEKISKKYISNIYVPELTDDQTQLLKDTLSLIPGKMIDAVI